MIVSHKKWSQMKSTRKNQFTKSEDALIRKLVAEWGKRDGSIIAATQLQRTPREVRDRYEYYLRPGLIFDSWSEEEDTKLRAKVEEYGTKWVHISRFFPGRSTVSLKNRWKYIKKHSCPTENIDVPHLFLTEPIFAPNDSELKQLLTPIFET